MAVLPPSTPRCIGDIGNEHLRQHHFDDGNLRRHFLGLHGAATGAGTTVHRYKGSRCRSLPPGDADPRVPCVLSRELRLNGCIGARQLHQVPDCWSQKGSPMKQLLLTSIAALFLATGAAHAGSFFEDYAFKTDICYVVKKTSDGFVAVRAKPDVKSEMFAALRPGYPLIASPDNQFLEKDEVRLYKNWTKWVYVKGWFV